MIVHDPFRMFPVASMAFVLEFFMECSEYLTYNFHIGFIAWFENKKNNTSSKTICYWFVNIKCLWEQTCQLPASNQFSEGCPFWLPIAPSRGHFLIFQMPITFSAIPFFFFQLFFQNLWALPRQCLTDPLPLFVN